VTSPAVLSVMGSSAHLRSGCARPLTPVTTEEGGAGGGGLLHPSGRFNCDIWDDAERCTTADSCYSLACCGACRHNSGAVPHCPTAQGGEGCHRHATTSAPAAAAAAAALATAAAAPAAVPALRAPRKPGCRDGCERATVLVARVTNLQRAALTLGGADELRLYHRVMSALDGVVVQRRTSVWKVSRYAVSCTAAPRPASSGLGRANGGAARRGCVAARKSG
jgi:hypothetical protein